MAVGDQAHDLVAGAQPGDPGACFLDDAGAFAADVGVAGIHAQADEDVAEVQAGGADGDADLPGLQGGGGGGAGGQGEAVQGSRGGDLQPPGGGIWWRRQQPVRAGPGQPGGVQDAVAHGDLGFAGGQRGRDGVLGGVVPVGVQHGEVAGVFRLGGAEQAPHRGGGQVSDVLTGPGGDRAAGDDDQVGCGEPVIGEPVLDQRQRLVGGGVRGPGQRGGGQYRAPGQDHARDSGTIGDGQLQRRQVRVDRGGREHGGQFPAAAEHRPRAVRRGCCLGRCGARGPVRR